MIIKELIIKNFRSYYGDNNRFSFSDGLTLIIGDNGDGKTTFFEALQWLFNTTIDRGSVEHVSEMRKSKLEVGESDEVKVSMTFEHDGEKSIEKSFRFEKTENGIIVSNVQYRAFETSNTERVSTDGKLLINRCYDAFIQRYSMFKGESDLNVFDNSTALKELVDKFSDIRQFDRLEEYSANFAQKARKAYDKQMSNDDKNSKLSNSLQSKMVKKDEEIRNVKNDIKSKNISLDNFEKKLKELEGSKEFSKNYRAIKDRLKKKESEAISLRGRISTVNYNHNLLDSQWILAAFPPILKEFFEKCSKLSQEKKELENQFLSDQAAAKAKLETIKEFQGVLANGATELPWYLPNQETMEEMIHDHICKVCGREAPEGSEAYQFMVRRLEDYKSHVEAKIKKETEVKELEQQKLFKSTHIDDVHTLSIQLSGVEQAKIAGIADEIKDRLSLDARLMNRLNELNAEIDKIKDEKARLLINAGSISEDAIEAQFDDIKEFFKQKSGAETRLAELRKDLEVLEREMQELQEEYDGLKPTDYKAQTMQKVYIALDKIAKAFSQAKEDNLRRFLNDLQDRANEYLESLSANDFHGEIRLVQTVNESTEIRLFSSNNTEIKRPSGSQQTVMYIAVLFAISDFTKQKRDEDYPLIFDAATSSFGDSKEKGFYNVIDKIEKQCIIVTKDFITDGEVRNKDIADLTCSVYRIHKASGFDKKNMATLRTIIDKIR